jgi:LmbE family N-acetylglucosaminyl deacetylase
MVALDRSLRMLGHHKRVLMVGAHPDDEDTELLTILVRGMGAETGYLSLTRGEGGQNLIGPELGVPLGLIRTEELLAARELDGARQFFTRAYDFGFSKNLDDTWAHWPRDSVLKDVVRIVRRFRPQVIIPVFRGTPQDGHGQHQASAWAAIEAFRVAGDSAVFPELLTEEGLAPHTPLKLYRSTRQDTAATTLTLDGGALDPAVGKTFHQIAMESRSRHRSQDMGRLQEIGPSKVRVRLLEDRTGRGEGGIFAGVDTLIGGAEAEQYRARVAATRRSRAASLEEVARLLDDADALLARLGQRACGDRGCVVPPEWFESQFRRLQEARAAARGLLFDAVADDERVVPGQTFSISTEAWDPTGAAVELARSLRSPDDWRVSAASDSGTTAGPPGRRARSYRATPQAGTSYSVPYFLRAPIAGAMYAWPTDGGGEVAPSESPLGLPFEPPAASALLIAEPGRGAAAPLRIEREVSARFNDQASGEVRRPVFVVPRIDVRVDPDSLVWPAGGGARRFTVRLTHGAKDTTRGRVALELPPGWPAVAPQSFTLTREDETRDFVFEVRYPAGVRPGEYSLRAVATDERGRRYDVGLFRIDYPHIRPRAYASPSEARVVVAPLALPKVSRVGYVRGASDRIPEALRSVGLPVELLDARMLARGDLSRYDVIVVGPRAYETDAALVANNERLLDYARRGGRLVVQYQQYQFVSGGFAPYRLEIARPHARVTDEGAAVTALVPGAPALAAPNAIGADDWKGWIQERSLYMLSEFADEYRPLLEMHDPGEPPQRGALLEARLGRGTYVYTGLAFFRQLPAGVPGAFRLFLNLLQPSPAAVP